jgi:hypothetical protein
MGVARGLLEFAGLADGKQLVITHWHPDAKTRFGRARELVYDPYRFFWEE